METATKKFRIARIKKSGKISISRPEKLSRREFKKNKPVQENNRFNLAEYLRSVKPHIGLLSFIK